MNRHGSTGIQWSNPVAKERSARLDRALVEQARGGDVDAFEAIVRSRIDAVYRLSLAILGDEADARVATQETFVAAWRRIASLRDPDRFEAWLQRIAVNAARMTLRGRRRRRVRELPVGDATAGVSARAAADQPPADAEVLAEALARLTTDQRTILALHHLEGRGLDEIGELLAIPVGTVKSRLFGARKALERALSDEGER
jgi:RNA polymerase sigma-70 factor (ECF subfamily)